MLGDNCPTCGYPLVGGTCANMCEDFPERSNLRQQLALAERRLKIAERAFQEAMAQVPSAAAVYVILHKALKDMEKVKHGS